MQQQKLQLNNKGFTLVDTIIVMAVITILVALTFPLAIDFLMIQREKEEELEQQEILRAMHAYAKDNKDFFAGNDITIFADTIVDYSDMTATAIEEDAWGRSRYFRSVVATENFRNDTLDIHYAFIYSTGTDGCWGLEEECDPTIIVNNVNALLGVVPSDYRTNFNAIEVPEGDFLIKFTNIDYQLVNYKKTVSRIDRLIEALSEYGRLKRYEGIADGEDENLIYFPPSEGPSTALFYTGVLTETSDETTTSDIYGAGGSDVILNEDISADDKMERRLGMIALTRVLGLPDEYCCNAMKKFVFGGEEYEEGLFYYSNPKARIDPYVVPAVCGAEATTIAERKLPPRITVNEDPCGK